jgi:hypothetical protein
MAHFLVSDDRFRDRIYGDDRRSYRLNPRQALGEYRFGRSKAAHGPLTRVNGTFRRMVEAIANSKLRRMERELELRGVRLHDDR